MEHEIAMDGVGDGEEVEKYPFKEQQNQTKNTGSLDLQYTIDDIPPWYLSILLGFQHYLTMFGGTLSIPFFLSPYLCMSGDDVGTSELLGTVLFVSGLITVLQSTVGVRLPIIQGGAFAYLVPALAILSLDKWKCPRIEMDQVEYNINESITNITTPIPIIVGSPEHREVWQQRIREIQGAIILASLFQVVIGMSGVIGLMLNFIGPLAIAPTIALIGISLFGPAAHFCAKNWGISLLTAVLVILFSQYLRNVNVPCLKINRKRRAVSKMDYPLFKLFPVILAILLAWALCAILTITNAFPNDKTHWAYNSRTDVKSGVLQKAKWFRFPYPGQWGTPTFSTAAVLGMVPGVLAGMIESVGDYYAAARLCGAPPPPVHAMNRGIFIEGFGCVLAGIWGTGTGSTSYSENIGAIGITKVGSRIVIQSAGCMMIVLGMFGKFGALFVTIPEPIIGGIFLVAFGMVAAVGISNLQFVNLNSSRNLFIFGFALFFGLCIPHWISSNPGAITTGNEIGDQILTILLSTSMFVGGVTGFVLDNTVPGTPEERGILSWRQDSTSKDNSDITLSVVNRCYDLPFVSKYLRKLQCTHYIPICPAFKGCRR